MKTVLAHLQLLRPLNLVTGAFAVFVSASILDKLAETTTVFIAMAVVVLYNAAANAINDVVDYDIDRINRPDRPLVSGRVNRQTALGIGIGLFIMGSLLAFTLPLAAILIAVVVALPLMALYSKIFKGLPLIGNIVVAGIVGLTFLFAGAALGDVNPLWVPAVLAFGLTLLRELVKDMSDLNGDRNAGLRTFPLRAGWEAATWLSIGLALMIGIGALIPYMVHYYSVYYGLIVLIGVELPLVYLLFTFGRNPDIDTATRMERWLKVSTIMGVIAVYFG